MCLILDTNMFGGFTSNHEDMRPIHNWLEKKNGKIVYTKHGKYAQEIDGDAKMARYLQDDIRGGSENTKLIAKEKIMEAAKELKGVHMQSNDRHILALAKAAGVTLLVSRDKNLHTDFKRIIGGTIYQNMDHKHLLTPDTCSP